MKRTPNWPIRLSILTAFILNSLGPLPGAYAQALSGEDLRLPAPGVMVRLSPPINPPMLKGLRVHVQEPFRFDFILDQGDSFQNQEQLKSEAARLIKYFLASLTIPEKDLWVNLSPYEKDRIIPQGFGLTAMGRDLLAEDYILKQITASLIYPEGAIGKKFWNRIYREAQKRYGTTNIPVNTFNKVWIVPQKAVVYENPKAQTVYVVESRLKVMLEEDYLSLQKHSSPPNSLASQVVREVVLPQLTQEVNEDKNFSRLRQVYNALILATWYKNQIKDSILNQVYANRNRTQGININDPQEEQKIYKRYLQAFKKGVYNYIKEERDELTQQIIPRKYFSGGVDFAMDSTSTRMRGIGSLIERVPTVPAGESQRPLVEVDGTLAIATRDDTVYREISPGGKVQKIAWGQTIGKSAAFDYDTNGEITQININKTDEALPKTAIALADGSQFVFEYKKGVPYVQKVGPGPEVWYYSGYYVNEKVEGQQSHRYFVTIKNFGSQYAALESDSHDSMYYVLRRLSRDGQRDIHLVFEDPHYDAYNADLVYSGDAHVTLANWVAHAIKRSYVKAVTWVYPQWYDPDVGVKHHARDARIERSSQSYDSVRPTGSIAYSVDFDAFAPNGSNVNMQIDRMVHPFKKEEAGRRVDEITTFLRSHKDHLVFINLNRSALARRQEDVYASPSESNHLLNLFVSSIATVLGQPEFTKVEGDPFDVRRPTRDYAQPSDEAVMNTANRLDQARPVGLGNVDRAMVRKSDFDLIIENAKQTGGIPLFVFDKHDRPGEERLYASYFIKEDVLESLAKELGVPVDDVPGDRYQEALMRGWQAMKDAQEIVEITREDLKDEESLQVWERKYDKKKIKAIFADKTLQLSEAQGNFIASITGIKVSYADTMRAFANAEVMGVNDIDARTGLPTYKQASLLFSRFLTYNESVRSKAVIMFDLDHFKHTNDNFSYALANRVLKAVGQAIRNLKARGVVNFEAYRYGGEEIALFINFKTLPSEAEIALKNFFKNMQVEVHKAIREFQDPDKILTRFQDESDAGNQDTKNMKYEALIGQLAVQNEKQEAALRAQLPTIEDIIQAIKAKKHKFDGWQITASAGVYWIDPKTTVQPRDTKERDKWIEEHMEGLMAIPELLAKQVKKNGRNNLAFTRGEFNFGPTLGLLQEDEFAQHPEKARALVEALGDTTVNFENLAGRIAWVNASIAPLQYYRNYLKQHPPIEALRPFLPPVPEGTVQPSSEEYFSSLSDEDLKRFALTTINGQRLTRAVLNNIDPFSRFMPQLQAFPEQPKRRETDRAMVAPEKNVGGINLNPALMNLQAIGGRNVQGGFKFHIDPAMLEELKNAPGFMPVIIHMSPMRDLRMFLGMDREGVSVQT